MATAIKDKSALPDYAKSTADRIENLGFKWEFEYKYPIQAPDTVQRVQIRKDQHAPPAEVTRYAQAMKRGDQFPPGVVTKDGRYVDFNSRAMAAHKLGWLDFPAFILNVRVDSATESELERLLLLGASFNTTAGKRLDRREVAEIIRKVARNPDWTVQQVAKLLGLTENTVKSVFAQFRAEERAERLGIHFNGSITESNKAMLGQRSEKLTDPPFAEIAKLTQEAGLTSEELRDLCNRVQEAGTEDAKVAVVKAERHAREAQIAHFKATAKKRPPESVNLRKRLGWIAGFEAKVSDLLDYNPATAAEYLKQVEEASALLQKLAEAQRKAIPEAGVEAGFKQQAVFATWPTWEALTADVLAQMESRKVVQREGGSWVKGPRLVTGQRIEIIPARPDVGSKSDGVTVWTKDVREARSSADHAIRTFGEFDAEVTQRGNRRVSTARKELILESMRQLGDLRDYFPVLLDEQGNVVDGRHRREIDPDWPASRTRVPAEKRLAVAAAANRTNGWSEKDWNALLDRATETTSKKTEAVRTLTRLALLEDASRSNATIARLVGSSDHTVANVRTELEETSQIARLEAKGGRGVTTGIQNSHSDRWVPDNTAEAITQEAQRRLEAGEPTDFRGLARQHGVGEAFVQQRIAVAKDRIERGDTAAEPKVVPPETGDAATESTWSRSIGLIGQIAALWRDAPPDRGSELKELEALRREIDERIEALRR
jgi:hypothetical protein